MTRGVLTFTCGNSMSHACAGITDALPEQLYREQTCFHEYQETYPTPDHQQLSWKLDEGNTMSNDETKPATLREEMINDYFSVKLIEAERKEDDEHLKFLHASHRLWREQRSLDIRLAQDIAQWQQETEHLNRLIPLRGPSRFSVSIRVTPPDWLSRTPAPLAVVLALALVVFAWTFLAMTMVAAWGGQTASWTMALCALLAWARVLRKIYLRRKGNS